VNAQGLLGVFRQKVPPILGVIPNVYAKAAGVIVEGLHQIEGYTDIETTTTTTTGVSNSKGWYFSVTALFGTSSQDAYKYPGQGDIFIILRDVLFVYYGKGGTVYLAPVAHRKPVTTVRASELKTTLPHLPPRLADKMLALDPLTLTRAQSPGVLRGDPRLAGKGQQIAFGLSPRRFKYFNSYECQPFRIGFSLNEVRLSNTGTTETTTETTVEKVGGLAVAIWGLSHDNVLAYSYSSSTELVIGDEQETAVELRCAENDRFEVHAYFDTTFRTILTVPGLPLLPPSDAAIEGRAMARRPVTLELGGKRYTVYTDDNGNFAFHFKNMPRGSGLLRVGNSVTPITYTGTPLKGLRVTIQGSPAQPAPGMAPGPQILQPGPKPGLPGRLPGGVQKRGTESDPTSPEAGQEGKMPEAEPGKSP
jgi:hypothetical protein